MNAHELADVLSASAEDVPAQARRRVGVPVGARTVRQIEAIDAWNAARRRRESDLNASSRSRLDKEAVKRESDGLRRTHLIICAYAAQELSQESVPMRPPAATAVIAHRHEWFAHRVALLLEAQGVAIIECTDNGADALGAVVAEQPNLLLAGDRLAMVSGDRLLAEARLFAPVTHLAIQASDPQQADAWRTEADSLFLRHHTPGHVADALGALCAAAHVC